MSTKRSSAATAITHSEIATILITALAWIRAASNGGFLPKGDSARALKSLPDDAPAVQPRASPSPPPAGGLALGGAIAATKRSSKSSGEGGKANERPAGTGRQTRPHLRHDAEGRRAVAGHLAERARKGRDRAAACAPWR